MIHILEYKNVWFDKNPNILFQYINLPIIFEKFLSKNKVINEFILSNKVIHKEIQKNETPFDEEGIINYINECLDCKIFIFNIECIHTNIWPFIVEKLSELFPNIKFIVITYETTFSYSQNSYNTKNVFYIVNSINNPYFYVDKVHQLKNIANYYIMNLYLQDNYNFFSENLFLSTKKLKRIKKYNFFNGVHKPHRLKCYELIKKHDMLNDGFFSYNDYCNFKNDGQQYEKFKNFFEFNSITDYLNYLEEFEIPYLCDWVEPNPNQFQAFLLPPQYALQSYISINTETYFYIDSHSQNVNFSEKSLKPFYGFDIPLLLGHHSSVRYLKDLGFDMFEDLFDLTFYDSKEKIFEQFEKNLLVIKNMSMLELHNYYTDNLHRVSDNFRLLTHGMFRYDLENLNHFLN